MPAQIRAWGRWSCVLWCEAPDADTAIRRAIEKFEIAPEHQDRIAARQIVMVR
jgi:hypothetical protein